MTGFREFFEAEVRGLRLFDPTAVPKAPTRAIGPPKSGPWKMNPLGSVPPSRPVDTTFRMGKSQKKTTVANRSH